MDKYIVYFLGDLSLRYIVIVNSLAREKSM